MPKNNVQALLSTDIPDPSDFPRPDLRQLDASLRCTICGELYDAPITLACGHCFCSLVGALLPRACWASQCVIDSAFESISLKNQSAQVAESRRMTVNSG